MTPAPWWLVLEDGAKARMSDLDERYITDAQRTQRAFLPSLRRLHGEPPTLTHEEEAAGLAEYAAEFGHGIARRHWWKLLARFHQRDGGAGDFSRVELFLSLCLRVPAQMPHNSCPPLSYHLTYLRTQLGFVRRDGPNAHCRASVFFAAFQGLCSLVDSGLDEADARRVVLAVMEAQRFEFVRPASEKDGPFAEVAIFHLVNPDSELERVFGEKLAEYRSGDFKTAWYNPDAHGGQTRRVNGRGRQR